MKFTQRLSLRVRLTLIFLILASVTWLLSSFVAWKQTTDNVDELFDTQLMLFAKRLSTLDLNEINAADRMAQTPNKLKHGHVDDDALTFAIFTHDGRMVLNDGDNGEDIPYSYQREGFADGQLVGDKDQWRFVWMTSPDGKYRIVVGQEWEYREDMALAIVAGQLIPWLVALPIMLIIMMVLLGRELAPLNKLALALRMRDPDSEKPLNATGVPSEVRPLVESLNQLFARTHAMMVRERRFRLKGKEVNTLIFPNLSSANATYQLIQSMSSETEVLGPIQMGLNKPIHFTDCEASVRDIVNITAVAVIDAIVEKKKKANK